MFFSIFSQGLIYAIMCLGVMISYRILDFPDLTVDGSFTLGAAISVSLSLAGVSPLLSLIFALLGGALAGLTTALIHIKLKVRDLLSGIISMTALYSINLAIAGSSNLPMFNAKTLFKSGFYDILPNGLQVYYPLMLLAIIALALKILLDFLLSTRLGMLLRAAGDNPQIITNLAKDKGNVKLVGLVISNAFVALSGAIMGQYQRFFEISMGTGTIVIGLASVILAMNIIKIVSFFKLTSCVIFASIIYRACVALAINLGFPRILLNLITALLFLIILVFGNALRGKKTNVETRGH